MINVQVCLVSFWELSFRYLEISYFIRYVDLNKYVGYILYFNSILEANQHDITNGVLTTGQWFLLSRSLVSPPLQRFKSHNCQIFISYSQLSSKKQIVNTYQSHFKPNVNSKFLKEKKNIQKRKAQSVMQNSVPKGNVPFLINEVKRVLPSLEVELGHIGGSKGFSKCYLN